MVLRKKCKSSNQQKMQPTVFLLLLFFRQTSDSISCSNAAIQFCLGKLKVCDNLQQFRFLAMKFSEMGSTQQSLLLAVVMVK